MFLKYRLYCKSVSRNCSLFLQWLNWNQVMQLWLLLFL